MAKRDLWAAYEHNIAEGKRLYLKWQKNLAEGRLLRSKINAKFHNGGRSPSAREQQVMQMIQIDRGISNKEIANKLCIETGTVKFHLRQIFRKLNIRNRNEL